MDTGPVVLNTDPLRLWGHTHRCQLLLLHSPVPLLRFLLLILDPAVVETVQVEGAFIRVFVFIFIFVLAVRDLVDFSLPPLL